MQYIEIYYTHTIHLPNTLHTDQSGTRICKRIFDCRIHEYKHILYVPYTYQKQACIFYTHTLPTLKTMSRSGRRPTSNRSLLPFKNICIHLVYSHIFVLIYEEYTYVYVIHVYSDRCGDPGEQPLVLHCSVHIHVWRIHVCICHTCISRHIFSWWVL